MTPEECRQTLGVSADAGAEAIRQAYLDLARVWHPDRFESDARLRKIAEQHFQQISQAYTTLKSHRPAPSASAGERKSTPHASATATADPPPRQSPPPPPHQAPPPPPPRPAWRPRPQAPPWARRRSWPVFRPRLPLESMRQWMVVGCLVAVPFFAAFSIVPLLRAPAFDTDLATSHAFRPRILEPMSSIDASTDVRTAADTLTEWAHGDVIDLWKPAGTQPAPARPVPAPAPRVRAAVPKPLPPPPASGAELFSQGNVGAGELGLSNSTNLEAIVKLARRNGVVARAVYLAPNANTVIRSIGVGVYNLYVELGQDLDAEHLRFTNNRVTPTPLGPFQFAEITSDSGVAGNRYDVVLNPR